MKPDQVVAVRDGQTLHYSRTDERGFDHGYILQNGKRLMEDKPLVSIMAHGYWRVPESGSDES